MEDSSGSGPPSRCGLRGSAEGLTPKAVVWRAILNQQECIGRGVCITSTLISMGGSLQSAAFQYQPSLEESVELSSTKLESRATKTRPTCDNREDGGLDIISSTLLRTNHQCNSAQIRSLNTIIAQRTDNIKAIDHGIGSIQIKINELMNSMKALKYARLQEEKDISCCNYILSPIRLLPPELLTNIFKYTVTMCRPSHRSESPLALAHVCSAWRDAVFGSSDFWNGLKLLVAPCTKVSSGVFSERVGSWYGRSNSSHPLWLSVWIRGTPKDPDVLADLSQSIAAFSPRFVKLSLDFMYKNYDALAPFLCLPPETLPALESLRLLAGDTYRTTEVDEPNDTPTLLPLTTVFAAAPRLRTLYLSIPCRLLTDPTNLRLPWAQLTHLEIANEITLSTFTQILFQRALHLHSAVFAYISSLDDPSASPPLIIPSTPQEFPHLKHLHLTVLWRRLHAGTPSIVSILRMLRLPNLQTLEVSCDHATFPAYALLPHLAEPGGTAEGRAMSLREIILCHVEVGAAELVGFLGRCTGVEKLGLFTGRVSPNEILRQMKKMGQFPRLREFMFVFSPDYAEGEDIRGVVKDFGALVAEWTKSGGGRRLRKAGLYVFSPLDDLDEEVLRAMGEDVRAAALLGDAERDVNAHGDDRVSAHTAWESRLSVQVEEKGTFGEVRMMFGIQRDGDYDEDYY